MFCVCCQTEKDESEFYKGNKSHCKVCIRERVRLNRKSKLEYYREYDRNRPNKRERAKKVSEYKNRLRKENPEKLDDFFTFNILMPLTTFWYFIQIPFRGLKWWKKLNEPLCKDKTFEGMFNKVFDNIENNNFDKAKNELDVLNHYTKYWL